MLVNKSMFPIQAGYNAISKMQGTLGELQTQLGNGGQKSSTLAGMGSDLSFSLALRGRTTKLDSYANNMSTVNLRLSFLDQSFTALSKMNSEARSSAEPTEYGENNLTMASLQKDSQNRLGLVIEALNANVGGRYLMGGNKTEKPPVVDYNTMMEGTAGYAGYKTVLAERNRADLGADVTSTLSDLGLPRTSISSFRQTNLTVSSKEFDRFGYQLFSISGDTKNITTTGPTTNPLNQTATFSENPNDGDTINVLMKQANHTDTPRTMKAVTTATATGAANEFLIEPGDPAKTAQNFQTALEALSGDFDDYSAITATRTPAPTGVPSDILKVTGDTDGSPSLGIKLNFNPEDAERFTVGIKKTDGTMESLQFVAKTKTTTSVLADGEYYIGDTPAETTANLQKAMESSIGALTAPTKMGRLAVGTPTTDTVTLAKTGGAFGYGAITSVQNTGSGVTVDTAATSVTFTGPVKRGDSVTFGVDMPDGTTTSLKLEAVEKNPEIGQFVIGSTPEETAKNFAAALKLKIDQTSKTELVSASTYAAADDFFTSDGHPQRVDVPPGGSLETATAKKDGSANTVKWYTGEIAPGTNPRMSASAQIDDSTKVGYGVRANEQGLLELVKTLAAMSTQGYPTGDDTSKARFSAMVERQKDHLSADNGAQEGSIDIIAMELGVVKSTIGNTSERNTAYAGQMDTMLTDVETVDINQTAMQLLALKTRLEASYQTTASISQLSLVNYLK